MICVASIVLLISVVIFFALSFHDSFVNDIAIVGSFFFSRNNNETKQKKEQKKKEESISEFAHSIRGYLAPPNNQTIECNQAEINILTYSPVVPDSKINCLCFFNS